ncbi:MAG TPA: type 2 isopentenyl-diphosphate Delta-isomerase [Symbiobacteriaceae bacterium]
MALAQTERAPQEPAAAGWDEVQLVHRSLPELALSQIDLSTRIAGVTLPQPVIINAMTGGAPAVEPINRDLAAVAAELGLAMAVGSQTAGLAEPETARTYRVVREANPRGVVLANLSAGAPLDAAQKAVDMVEANLLQIHLNAPQELMMPEGDRDFRGQLGQIAALCRALPVPVVVKECGFGLSRESVRQLYDVGVRAVDVSGRGGTNFAWIEAERRGGPIDPGLVMWGIPTAAALAEAAALALPGLDIVASGGITYGSEVAKALALGARAAGLAGAVLRRHQAGGAEGVRQYLTGLLNDLACAVLLAGARTLGELQARPVVVTGATGEWCRLRGVDLAALACRT